MRSEPFLIMKNAHSPPFRNKSGQVLHCGAPCCVELVVQPPVEGPAEALGVAPVRAGGPQRQTHSPVRHVGADERPRREGHLAGGRRRRHEGREHPATFHRSHFVCIEIIYHEGYVSRTELPAHRDFASLVGLGDADAALAQVSVPHGQARSGLTHLAVAHVESHDIAAVPRREAARARGGVHDAAALPLTDVDLERPCGALVKDKGAYLVVVVVPEHKETYSQTPFRLRIVTQNYVTNPLII